MEAVLAGELPERMVLMLQKEAAERYAATHGRKTFGAISIFLQSAFKSTASTSWLPSAFTPHPRSTPSCSASTGDRMPSASAPPPAIASAASSPSAANNWALFANATPESQAAAWFDQLIAKGVSPTIRPEELPIEHWQDLAKM